MTQFLACTSQYLAHRQHSCALCLLRLDAPTAFCLFVQVLKKICWYAVLAPSYSTEEGSSSDVSTLIATTAAYKQLGDLPLHQQLLTTFTNPEIVRWGLFEAQYGAEITAEVRQLRKGERDRGHGN